MSKIEVDAIDKQSGSTLTLGGSGTAVTLACGATQTGFGRTGTVDWQTSIKTTSFTAASGEGYFCDTATTGAFTLTLPSSPSVGDIVALKDYASNFATANLTIGRGGSNLNGDAQDSVRKTDNESLTLVYADATKGWLAVEEGTGFIGESFVTATGGTVTCSGNCRIHTFTGPGTLTVQSLSESAPNNVVSYMVVAGGGAGGTGYQSGGGGAGGFREYKSPVTPYTASPLDGNPGGTAITVSAQAYPITIGGGGTAPSSNCEAGGNGNSSIFSIITSAAGGGGGAHSNPSGPQNDGRNGGSGGGAGRRCGSHSGGSGNTPPVSPSQGNDGGDTSPPYVHPYNGGGGGGATAQGTNTSGSTVGPGGAGATTTISGSPTAYAGGGGGGGYGNPTSSSTPSNTGSGGTGGGGNGAVGTVTSAQAGTANTGGGGGGAAHPTASTNVGGSGGSGIVIIRYKFQ